MRKIALLSAVVAAAMAFANVSSASALSWTPQNTSVNVSTNDLSFMTGTGMSLTCNTSNVWTAKASGAVMSWSGGPVMSCTEDGFGMSAKLTTPGQWSQTATSTSGVILKGDTSPSGGSVLSIATSQSCSLNVRGPVEVSGVAWSNSLHQLTLNNTVPIKGSTSLCDLMYGSTLTIKGHLVFPSSVAIQP